MIDMGPTVGITLFWLGIAMIGAELIFLSFGHIGVLGICMILLAGIILESQAAINILPPDSNLKPWFIAIICIACFTMMRLVAGMFFRRSHAKERRMIGAHAKVIDWNGIHGHIYWEGEQWLARAHYEIQLEKGETVTIAEVDDQHSTVWIEH